jgi:isoleucyl-tRNA synthetase
MTEQNSVSNQNSNLFNLASIEEDIFKYWNENNIFELSLTESKERPLFNFYDGPPFATGTPHYGHILASTIKDAICRFQTINGKYVPRINGFDCHGLPIEQIGEKALGIRTASQINEIGIDKFNQKCASLVLSCADTWEQIIPRMGRWIDFKNGYKTMDFEFMNAVWGVFKTIFNKGLVYRSLTPMPYSTGCGSCLSHFEAKSNYQDTQDPSVVIKFMLENPKEILYSSSLPYHPIYFLVWTTTPYSLTANIALCINEKIQYSLVRVKQEKGLEQEKEQELEQEQEQEDEDLYIIAKEAIKNWETKTTKLEIIRDLEFKDIIGLKYIPPFKYNNYLLDLNLNQNQNLDTSNLDTSKGKSKKYQIFSVVEDSYVKVESGTGIVHLAPSMGEDDFRVALKYGLIDVKNTITIPCPIDDTGCLTVEEYKGIYVKSADKMIIKDLKALNLVFEAKTIFHSYPFCYRTDTPLITKSISAWFIDVHKINDTILDLNKKINWVPSAVGEARFTQWLSTPRDWSFGRNRFWGTPVPIWVNEDFSEIVCVGSVKELMELANIDIDNAITITDLHREFIDNIKIPSKKNDGTYLTRINDVFDCWFESGSMPYGKYAVEKKFSGSEIYDLLNGINPFLRDEFMKYFPADFIGEGLDQTRGWFYTLLVISTILFEDTAYKNVIVNGLILASNPQANGKWVKMSKRHLNYSSPLEMINKYGADSIRLYLLDSPVTKAEPLKFQEEGLVLKGKFLVQWFNCYQFLEAEVKLFMMNLKNTKTDNNYFELVESSQIYDQWILGKLKELIEECIKYYQEFKLYMVIPLLVNFEDLFSRWYLNLAKNNMKGFYGVDIQWQSLSTLWKLLRIYSVLTSPITPFMSDKIYLELGKLVNPEMTKKSVHLELLEEHLKKLIVDLNISKKLSSMVEVVMAFRGLKTGAGISTRMKSKEVIIKHTDQEYLDNVKELEKELLTVVKVDKIIYQVLNLENDMGTDLSINFNSQMLGKLVKKDINLVLEELKKQPIKSFLGKEEINILGYSISSDMWSIVPRIVNSGEYLTQYTENGLYLSLSKDVITTPMEEQMELMIKAIQKAKKEANLKPFQIVDICITIINQEFKTLILEEQENIANKLRSRVHVNQTNYIEHSKFICNLSNEYYTIDMLLP